MTKKITWDMSSVVGTIGENKVVNWNGFMMITGAGKSTSILDDIQYRRRKVKQNAIVIVGSPGEGKSYFALRLSQLYDPTFNPYLQIVFERTHLLWLVGPNSPLKMGQVILIDEAQFIAGARRWYEDVQKDVMEHLEAIRSKGYIIIIVALHVELLDKIVRNYVLSCMMSMIERGRAKVYNLWTPVFENKQFHRGRGTLVLQIPSFEQCAYPNCLICKYIEKCQTVRAIYERMKRDFLAKMALQSQQKAAIRERKQRIINYNDTLTKVIAYRADLVFRRNRVDSESVKIILEEKYGLILTDSETNKLIKRGAIKYPEVFNPQEKEN